MVNLLIVFVSTVLIAAATVIVFDLANRFFRKLSCRLEKIKPKDVRAETPATKGKRDVLVVVLSTLLATSIGIMELAGSLGGTLLNPDFVSSELNKLDISAVAAEFLNSQSPDQLNGVTGEPTPAQVYSAESVELTLVELGPWISEQENTAVYAAYDYFLRKTAELDVVIPLVSVQEALRRNIRTAVLRSPPPELGGASPEQIQSYIDDIYELQFAKVPAELELSSKNSGAYNQIRRVTGFLLLLPRILLPLVLLLIVAIILVHRNLKTALWTLGFTLVISGILGFLYAFIAREAGIRTDVLTGVPTFNRWLIQVVTDILATIKQPGFILFGVGGAMLLTSFLWMRLGRGKLAAAKAE